MKILVVDDEPQVGLPIKERLVSEGYAVLEAKDGSSANALLEREVPDLVLLDIRLPDTDSIGMLQTIQERVPDLPVIITTTSTSNEKAIEAMKLGAFDYVAKSANTDELALTVKRALEAAQLRRTVALQVREHKALYGVENLIGQSKAMHDVRTLVERVSSSQTTTILARGESGTGKDLIAKAIHAESPRAALPYVNITCTALQDTLLESELFGHEKGSFTDAKARKKGLLELAQGGTVFLDEIGDMSPALQGKLLRVLEDKTFRRIGGIQDIRVDIRVVAATHVDLERQIEERKFREDLYYRLNAITIDVPPLRERREDIPLLVEHFLKQFARELGREVSGISEDALEKLKTHGWPGNVRELRNVIERAVLLGSTPEVSATDIVLGRSQASRDGKRLLTLPAAGLDLVELDRELVVQALERAEGNQTKAAALLGLTRDKIHYRMEKYGLLGGEAAK
jgi:two-component system, NtrC family, response regulator AtoC